MILTRQVAWLLLPIRQRPAVLGEARVLGSQGAWARGRVSKLGDFPFALPWYSLTYFGFLQITALVLSVKAPKLGFS